MVKNRTTRHEEQGKPSDAADRLIAGDEDLAAALQASPVVVFRQDRDLRYTWVHNPRLGYTAEQLVGRTDDELFERSEDAQRLKTLKKAALASGIPQRQVVSVFARGIERWYDLNLQPQRDSNGAIIGILGTSVDLTDQKRAEAALAELNETLERQVAERTLALREREDRLRAILETATDAIITIDRRGVVESLNSAAVRMFGFTAAEAVGRNVNLIMPSPHAEEHDGYLRRYQETGAAHIIGTGRELIAQHKDGRLIPISLSVSQVDHLGLYTGVIRDISRQRMMEEELLRIAGEEQQRIGHDLHDQAGQELTALLLLADSLVEEAQAGSLAGTELAIKVRDGLRRVLSQIRSYSRGLMPVDIDGQGLQTALAGLAAGIGELDGIDCTFECPSAVLLEDHKVATHLYRIAQEATTNAVKHAQPRHIQISLRRDGGRVQLRVVDDGSGINRTPVNSSGLGLRIMQHRANLIGARLSISPGVGGGTELVCTLGKETNDGSAP